MKNINGDALRKKACQLDLIGKIYDDIVRNMQWDCMTATDETDSDGRTIYTPPEQSVSEDGDAFLTYYERYLVYQKALDAIEKLAK